MSFINERIELNRLIYCYKTRATLYETYFSKEKDAVKRKQWITKFDKFLIASIQANGNRNVQYEMPEAAIEAHGSRLYAENGIQGIPCDIRGFLCRGYTTDIDAKNCHPVILKYICNKHSIPCPHLSHYIDNRDYLLTNNFRTKDEGKRAILIAMNSSDPARTKVQFLKSFDEEMKSIQSALYRLPEYETLVQSIPADKQGNALGSLLNRICCSEENKMLSHVERFFKERRIETFAKCFDGILVYGSFYDKNELLGELEEYVEEQIPGLNMKFSYKDHSTVIPDIPADWVCPSKESVFKDERYMQWKANFEQDYCKIISKAAYLNTTTLEWKDKKDLIVAYEHQRYDKQEGKSSKSVAFINEWLIDPDMRVFQNVGVYPNPTDCPPGTFNLWKPFVFDDRPITPDDPEFDADAVAMFINHVKTLIGDDSVALWLCNWMAHMFQKPQEKPSCCIWLVGEQGCGKSTITAVLTKLVGLARTFETSSPERDVWGNFNSMMASSYLLVLSEIDKRNLQQADGKIKTLMTQPTMTINNKGQAPYEISSYHRVISCTNMHSPTYTGEHDRRNVIIKCNDTLMGNLPYFDKMYAMCEDLNALRSIYWSLKNTDISGWDFRKVPKTEYHKEIIKSSRSTVEEFLRQFGLANRGATLEMLSSDLLDEYSRFCTSQRLENNMSARALMSQVKLKYGIEVEVVRHTKRGDVYKIGVDSIVKKFNLQHIVLASDEGDEEN